MARTVSLSVVCPRLGSDRAEARGVRATVVRAPRAVAALGVPPVRLVPVASAARARAAVERRTQLLVRVPAERARPPP